jgi:diacylglycerol O-acyltransferase
MKKLSMIDKGFLFQESREMPMHVGSLNLYTLPDNADEQEFLHGSPPPCPPMSLHR